MPYSAWLFSFCKLRFNFLITQKSTAPPITLLKKPTFLSPFSSTPTLVWTMLNVATVSYPPKYPRFNNEQKVVDLVAFRRL